MTLAERHEWKTYWILFFWRIFSKC